MSSKIGVFRYFIPGVEPLALTPQEITARGLQDRLGDLITGQASDQIDGAQVSLVRAGPDGTQGTLIVPLPPCGSVVERADFSTDGQRWVKADRGEYWIGMDNEHPPTPTGMQRPRLVRGVAEKLGDGQVWECPTVRSEILQPRVPCSYGMSGERVIGRVLPQYTEVWHRSNTWCVRLLKEYQEMQIVDLLGVREAFEASVLCLSLNYRMGVKEATLLQLLDDDALEKIIDAAIDAQTFRDLCMNGDQKKRLSLRQLLADWQSTLRGSGVSTPDTHQPAPTSN